MLDILAQVRPGVLKGVAVRAPPGIVSNQNVLCRVHHNLIESRADYSCHTFLRFHLRDLLRLEIGLQTASLEALHKLCHVSDAQRLQIAWVFVLEKLFLLLNHYYQGQVLLVKAQILAESALRPAFQPGCDEEDLALHFLGCLRENGLILLIFLLGHENDGRVVLGEYWLDVVIAERNELWHSFFLCEVNNFCTICTSSVGDR